MNVFLISIIINSKFPAKSLQKGILCPFLIGLVLVIPYQVSHFIICFVIVKA